MHNVRISRLLPALFLLMVVLGALQGAVAFRSLSAMTGHIERIGTDRMPQLSAILQLSHAFSDLNAIYAEHLLSMDPDEIGRIEARIKERTEAVEAMVKTHAADNSGDAAAIAGIDTIKATLTTYLDEAGKLVQFSADRQSLRRQPQLPPRRRLKSVARRAMDAHAPRRPPS